METTILYHNFMTVRGIMTGTNKRGGILQSLPKKKDSTKMANTNESRISVDAIAPKLNVRGVADVTSPFDITGVSHVAGNKYNHLANTWRVYATDIETGEPFLMLFQGNQMRDEVYGKFENAIGQNPNAVIGPCEIEVIPLDNGNHTYNIITASA